MRGTLAKNKAVQQIRRTIRAITISNMDQVSEIYFQTDLASNEASLSSSVDGPTVSITWNISRRPRR
ncbi:hypothetical protein WJ64_14905 [Burkholderia ubonensis]|nr:hypothetical protein WJ64_14905 [Burkholderia ubonensis]